MNTKKPLVSLIAAAALAVAGVAVAQSTPEGPSSTPGAGCTATANAMRGGNLGGSPSSTACTTRGSAATTAAKVEPAQRTAATRPAAMNSADTGATRSSAMGNADASGSGARTHTRVARADRN